MRRIATIWLMGVAAGCAVDGPDAARGVAGAPLTEEEIDQQTLAMLNDPTTTVAFLDDTVKLTSTVAAALIAHRDGLDAVLGTADDDLYDTIQEVDDIKGVGPSTLAQIRAFAATWSPAGPPEPPPEGTDLDEQVLAFMNHPTTTLTLLDVDVGLTVTAAKKLIEHRDGADALAGTADDDLYGSIAEIDAVPYVGEAALASIKAYAATWSPTTDPVDPPDPPTEPLKVLVFVNHPTTTRQVLEKNVGLTATQSANLLNHRDGPDATLGTTDDDPYDSVAEIDAQPYIGAVTIQKLVTFAETWVALDPETAAEQKALIFVNHPTATENVLTGKVGLALDTAKAIVAHRAGLDGVLGTADDDPIDSLKELDDIKGVGQASVDKIVAYAETFDPNYQPPENLPLSCATCSDFAGDPLEYDPGPPAGSGWAQLFADVPNFRTVAVALGQEWLTPGPDGLTKYEKVNAERAAQVPPLEPIPLYTLTSDKFRYHMGPLFYRGRLDGTARVLVVGQEGATDEAIVHRAFVGGTGQKVQNFLNSIGITKSYVCVNTFVYSIYEQYDEFTAELAMSGPIKEHRNQILKKIFDENPIQLVLTFGNAAYESVKTFREEYYAGKFPKGVRWSHMLHPGAAATGYEAGTTNGEVVDAGVVKAVVDSFTTSWKRIWYWRYIDPGWLAPDPDGWQFQSSKFYYGDRDIPYRDLPYGASVQLGRGGTKTERGAGGLQVQLHSQNAIRYEAPAMIYPASASKALSGYVEMTPAEVSWEPPKFDPEARYDAGPSPEWVSFFAGTPSQDVIEAESGIDTDNDFKQTPLWYRGRLNGAPRVLVIAMDSGFDQVVAGRALVGEAGQKITHLLANLGVGTDYLVLSAYPYPINPSVPAHDHLNLAMSLSLSAYRDQLLTKVLQEKPITLVLTLGEVATAAFQSVSGKFGGTWIPLAHPEDASAPLSWSQGLQALAPLQAALGLTGPFKPYAISTFKDVRAMIPREDLPWGVPLWFGTSGNLSQMPDRTWLYWNAPKWVAKEPFEG